MTVPNPALRALAVVALLAVAPRVEAQPGAHKKAPAIVFYPQAGNQMQLPATLFSRPAFDPGPFYNPALNNPFLNQTNVVAYNPFAPNPFVANPFNNPFAVNPFAAPIAPVVTATPPAAFRQPGQLLYKGPDLQVNPVSGLVYKPLSGIARTGDGSTFYYIPGTGLPTTSGAYATGTGLYYDPNNNTFLNPSTGTISRPGVTTVFIPWRP